MSKGALRWLCSLLFLLLFATAITASGAETIKTFGGSEVDSGNSIRSIANDGYIIAGSHDKDIWILKVKPDGTKDWGYINPNGKAMSVALIGDSYIATGSKGSALWLSKIDKNGVVSWEKTFGVTGKSIGYSVSPTTDGGYIIVGTTDSKGAGKEDIWLIKTDSQGNTGGNKGWDYTFGGPYEDRGLEVHQVIDGYIIVGTTQTPNNGMGDIWLIKTDLKGVKSWDKTFGKAAGPAYDYGGYGNTGSSVVPVTENNEVHYILALTKCPWGSPNCDGWLMKLDSSGNPVWEKNIGDPKIEDYISKIQPTSDGGIIAVGSAGTDGSSADVIVTKASKSGDVIWSKRINAGFPNYNLGRSIDPTQDGGYAVTGSSFFHPTSDDQLLLIIYHPDTTHPSPLDLTDKQRWWKWLTTTYNHF